ncbi:hypothetical protein PRVXT_002971 [Proteinivorax tanatarense]|uniref:Colicin V production protein n=1 Tax=Proteinivorax tanatarense TaxID=1260629 RepID=A0AAU7VLA2_9FIRM
MADVFIVVLFIWGIIIGFYKDRKEIFIRGIYFVAALFIAFGINWPVLTEQSIQNTIETLYIDDTAYEVSTDRTYLMIQEATNELPVSTQLREKIIENMNERVYLGESMVNISAEIIAKAIEALTLTLIIILIMSVSSEFFLKNQLLKSNGGVLGATVYGLCNLILACVIIYIMELYFLFYQKEAIKSGLLDFALKPLVQQVIDVIFKLL